jgi:hypothetical protein
LLTPCAAEASALIAKARAERANKMKQVNCSDAQRIVLLSTRHDAALL